MHPRFDTILARIRQDVACHLAPESIREACRACGHRWRQRVLTPVAIVHWFLTQILDGRGKGDITIIDICRRQGGARPVPFPDSLIRPRPAS